MKGMPDAVAELSGLRLGDARRDGRARKIIAALQANPAMPFPRSMGSVAAREAFYRLVNNEAVSLAALLAPHSKQTVERMLSRAERPIIAIDKTGFVFEGDGDRDGLDRLSANKQGFDAFFALAVSPTRRTHGVVAAEILEGQSGRSTAAEWSTFIGLAGHAAEAAKLKPIYVMDREADTYELFCALVEQQRDFVVRISFDRIIREFKNTIDEPIRDIAMRAPAMLTRTVRIARRKAAGRTARQRQKHPPRPTRDAELSVRVCPITLPRPAVGKLAKLPKELTLHLVQVTERIPPKDSEPVEWLLITTLPINDSTSVEAIVDAYRARWCVEEFFKALKTGCKYEERQLESLHALLNTLGLLIPVAWRLLELRTIGEDEPDTPASDFLDVDEIHVLRKLSKDVKLGPSPTAKDALLAIASVGGHIRQNGRPGWSILYTGFKTLLDRVDGYRLAKAEM
jgi:hypothetical protein